MESLLTLLLLLSLRMIPFLLSPSLFSFHCFPLPPSHVLVISLTLSQRLLSYCLIATNLATDPTMMEAREWAAERAIVRMAGLILRLTGLMLRECRRLLASVWVWLQGLC